MSYRQPKERPIGPFSIHSLLGEYVIMDRGRGNQILKANFKSWYAANSYVKRMMSPGRDGKTAQEK